MQAISLALGIEALTACASIGWEHGRDGKVSKTSVPMAESDKDTTWGIKALSSRSYKINLEKQHAIVFNLIHVREVT